VLLLTGVYGFYNASSQSYSSGITGQTLQDGANIVLSKISEGETEAGTVYRLSTAVSYMIPNGTSSELYSCGGAPQAAPCNTHDPFSEVYYCELTNPTVPCSALNTTARWYYLNSTGTSVIYHHTASLGGTIEENIYTAPEGTTMTLRFSPAQSGGMTLPNVLEMDVALMKNVSGSITNNRLMASGAASTFVLLRSHA